MEDKFTAHVRKKRQKVEPPQNSRFFPVKSTFSWRRKIFNSAVACAIIALGVLGMSVVDTAFTNEVTDGLRAALNSEMINDEDLGKLRLVGSQLETEATEASAREVVIPLDGEIVATFAQTGMDVVIKSDEREPVRAIYGGLVVKTMTATLVVENDNGTQTTYEGVLPGIKAGTNVIKGTTLGQLEEDTLTLTTVSHVGYIDSLAEEDS